MLESFENILFIGGEYDARVPIQQGYEMYTALNLQMKTVKMLILKNQGHVPTEPNAISVSLKAIEDWLKQKI